MNRKEMAKRLAKETNKHGWNASDLAREGGFGERNCQRWIAGHSIPSVKALISLALLLGVSVDYILAVDVERLKLK